MRRLHTSLTLFSNLHIRQEHVLERGTTRSHRRPRSMGQGRRRGTLSSPSPFSLYHCGSSFLSSHISSPLTLSPLPNRKQSAPSPALQSGKSPAPRTSKQVSRRQGSSGMPANRAWARRRSWRERRLGVRVWRGRGRLVRRRRNEEGWDSARHVGRFGVDVLGGI